MSHSISIRANALNAHAQESKKLQVIGKINHKSYRPRVTPGVANKCASIPFLTGILTILPHKRLKCARFIEIIQ